MALRTHPSWLGPIVILLLCSTFVTPSLIINHPETYWLDPECIGKTRPNTGIPAAFTVEAVQESLYTAFRGSRRLLNGIDAYEAWLFQFLFKIPRPTIDLLSDSTPWLVIRKALPVLSL